MFNQLLLSVFIALISIIMLRLYDKYHNKQYSKSIYINNFIQVFISSIIVLTIYNNLQNYNLPQLPQVNKLNGGSNINVNASSTNNIKANQKSNLLSKLGAMNDNVKFDTGLPNF